MCVGYYFSILFLSSPQSHLNYYLSVNGTKTLFGIVVFLYLCVFLRPFSSVFAAFQGRFVLVFVAPPVGLITHVSCCLQE